jgi:hypothetical protein
MNFGFGAIVTLILGVVALVTILGGLLAYPLMLLWNSCLVPAVPVLQEVTWLQMWGISILCGCLFKSTNVNSK